MVDQATLLSRLIVGVLGLGSGVAAQQAAFALPGARVESAMATSEFVLASDLDCDGWIDLVVPHPKQPSGGFTASGFEVRRGGPQGFTATALVSLASQGIDAALADGDGDGLIDVIVIGAVLSSGPADTSLWLHAGEGGAGFAAAVGGAVDGPNPYLYADMFAVADFNLDGRGDVVLRRSESDGASLVSLASAAGGFMPQQTGLFPEDSAAGGIETFDADGDGDPDVAQSTQVFSKLGVVAYLIHVALDDGQASFTELPPQTFPSIGAPDHLLAADLDGDGLQDLVTYAQDVFEVPSSDPLQAGRVGLLRSLGNGSFIEQGNFAAAGVDDSFAFGTDLAVSDVDGDGFLDVLTFRGSASFGQAGGPMLSVLRGSSDPFALTTLPTVALPASPSCLTVADIDGDGRTDLAFGQSGKTGFVDAEWGDVRIALGRGDGTFALPDRIDLPAPLTQPNGIVLADLDGDKDLDVIATCSVSTSGIAVALADATEGFSSAQDLALVPKCDAAVSADLDGDGESDLVMDCGPNSGLLTALSAGDGSHFSPPAVVSNSDVDGLGLADLDLDGDMDLYTVVSFGSTVDVRAGLGDGSFGPADSNPAHLLPVSAIAADLDSDGLPDLAVAISDSLFLDLLHGVGGGTFAPVTSIPTAASAARLAVGDIDGNGWVDIALAHQNSGLSVLKGLGGGLFSIETVATEDVHLADIAIVDVDRDARPDVAGIQFKEDAVRVWPTAADGTLGVSYVFDAGEDPAAMAVGDIDGDGQPDIVVAAQADDAVWHMKGIATGVSSLGFPLAGRFGTPHLLVTGEPEPTQLVSITAFGVPAPAVGFLVLGLELTNQPFHGGTLVPSPDAAIPMLPDLALAGRWPELAKGTPVYAQAWFAASGQLVATNSIVAFTH